MASKSHQPEEIVPKAAAGGRADGPRKSETGALRPQAEAADAIALTRSHIARLRAAE